MDWKLTRSLTGEPEIDEMHRGEDLRRGYSLLRELASMPTNGLYEIRPGMYWDSKLELPPRLRKPLDLGDLMSMTVEQIHDLADELGVPYEATTKTEDLIVEVLRTEWEPADDSNPFPDPGE